VQPRITGTLPTTISPVCAPTGAAAPSFCATALALAVVEPMMSGLGGDAFYHAFDAHTGRAVVFNGTGPAPAAATPERYAGGIPRIGPLSVSVPGTVSALGMMHRRYGRLPWRELLGEAIAFARDGFGATLAYSHFSKEYRATLLSDPRSATTFLVDGQPPALGAAIVQPDLARTLEEIAADGAETFYRGRLARRLAGRLQEPDVWPRPQISKPSMPRSKTRSLSTIAASPCSKRRQTRPASCCSRN